ncbi:MAG: hypothetical protein KatS3mg007_0628 [Thermoanaerobaculum sp.]|nr:MAG: hypothetical protein KatS3mg007_0628 [Thermoanaerobaculum sp.]
MHSQSQTDWEALLRRLTELPANHRRVVVALLEVFARELRELARVGVVAANEEEFAGLEKLAAHLRGGKPNRNWQAVLTLLEIQLEELQPRKLSAYGPLTAEQENAIRHLVAKLQSLLATAG